MIDFEKLAFHAKHTRFAEEADDLEWRTAEVGNSPYSASQMDDEISDTLADVESRSESDAAEQPSESENAGDQIRRKLRESNDERDLVEKRSDELTAGVRAEIERRSRLLGDDYPFEACTGSLKFLGSETPSRKVYMECLKTSVTPTPEDREAFEKLVADALEVYLGKGRAKVQLFGWQRQSPADQPRRIKGMITKLYEDSGEWTWQPAEGFPNDPPPKLVKDLGLDAVAWLPMPDKRAGRIFLIAQCATGKTDWDSKLNDVTWDRITNWIRPTPHRWSIRCFAIPFHLPNEVRWREVSGEGGLFLDRVRLTLLLKES